MASTSVVLSVIATAAVLLLITAPIVANHQIFAYKHGKYYYHGKYYRYHYHGKYYNYYYHGKYHRYYRHITKGY
jgi:hypothetical protein